MRAMNHLSEVLWHNAVYLSESITAWVLVCFAHIIGLSVEHPIIIDILPYIQLVVYVLAGVTSIATLYKIHKDLKK